MDDGALRARVLAMGGRLLGGSLQLERGDTTQAGPHALKGSDGTSIGQLRIDRRSSRQLGHPASSDRTILDELGLLLVADHDMRAALGQIDHVTLLPNRQRFVTDFANHGRRAGDRPRSLVLVTLAEAQHFNSILRALGHAFSDDFVRAGALQIKAVLPPGTILYHVSVLSVAFMIDADETDPPAVVTELARAFSRPLTCQGLPIATRAGVGLYRVPRGPTSPAEALRAALGAAQDSRSQSRGWSAYNRRADEAHQRGFMLLTDLREALGREASGQSGQLSLHYQPRIAMHGGGLAGAETLIRWTHPTLGSISPAEFIPLAEATGLMQPLTDWILDTSLRQIAVWAGSGPPVKVSINISPSSLQEEHFVRGLLSRMHTHGVPPELVELEFTEGTLASTADPVVRQIDAIRSERISIAIDDFGTGYSNLDYLTRLPGQVLKIDQSFIRPLLAGSRHEILVRSMIELAHGLGYTVVGEGIETQACYDLLCGWGCDEGQGYHMSRPLPVPQFTAWAQAHTARLS